jgi:hypothetical protein
LAPPSESSWDDETLDRTTGADGAYHRFTITADTVKVVQEALQRSLDSLTWEGFSTVTPLPSGPMDRP